MRADVWGDFNEPVRRHDNQTPFAEVRKGSLVLRSWSVLTVLIAGLMLAAMSPRPAVSGPTLVFDVTTGTVLHDDDAGKPWYPASLTKLMTAYVVFHAIKEGRLKLDSKITYSLKAQREPASKIGLPEGTKLSVDWGLQALLVRSANDIAVALAEAVGGTEAGFVQMMNEHARRLAMTGSYFSNPHGLPDRRNITTARDMGLLARAIIREFPEYQRFFDADFVKHGKRRLKNRNAGFLNISEHNDGLKTGFICNSGFNVVASQTREGRRLVAVVMGAKNGGIRAQTANALLTEAFVTKPGGILNRPKKLIELTNGGLFARYPTDMAKTVCRRMGNVRITSYRSVRGHAVIMAHEKNATDAQKFLDRSLKPLKDIVYGGRAVVVREPYKGTYAAMIYDLDSTQSQNACNALGAAGKPCEVLAPETYKEVIAALEAEAKAKAEEAKQKKLEKWRKYQERKKQQKRRSNSTRSTRTKTTSSPAPAPQISNSLR